MELPLLKLICSQICFGELTFLKWFMHRYTGASLVTLWWRIRLPVQETWVWSLGQEDLLEKEMQPTPVFLPGESHRRRSMVGYSPWGHKESTWLSDFASPTVLILTMLIFFLLLSLTCPSASPVVCPSVSGTEGEHDRQRRLNAEFFLNDFVSVITLLHTK